MSIPFIAGHFFISSFRLLLGCVLALLLGGNALAQHHQTLELPAGAGAQNDAGSIQFIGTATVIIRYAGMTILTDPNFLHKGDHVHLGYGLTSERLTEPAIAFEQLPPIDFVLLSHMHGDHFDQLVQEKLDRKIPIVSTPPATKLLADMGFQSRYPLDTWETLTVKKGDAVLRITAMPGRHGPGPAAALLPTVMGSMLEWSVGEKPPAYRMYISGDTLVYDELQEIPRRYPDIDLALLHLGGTRILGVMKVTMDGKDGVRLMQIVAPHHATRFTITITRCSNHHSAISRKKYKPSACRTR